MSRRTERLESEIRQEVARIVAREIKDPRLGFVTVTRVELAADLRYVRILVSVLGEPAARERSVAVLRQAAGFVRRELGRRLRLRLVPEVDFRADTGIDNTDRVARLLDEMGPIPEPEDDPES